MEGSDWEHQAPGTSAFRDAFSRARFAALDVRDATGGDPATPLDTAQCPRFEYRVERRRKKRKGDLARWNTLGRKGWELVTVTDRGAVFKRQRFPRVRSSTALDPSVPPG